MIMLSICHFQCPTHKRLILSPNITYRPLCGSSQYFIMSSTYVRDVKHNSRASSYRFLPHPRVKVSVVGSLRDREIACSASDRQGSNFKSRVWRAVSSQSSHHPQEVLLAQFSLYVHKGVLKPDSFHLCLHSDITVMCSHFHMDSCKIHPLMVL